MFMKNHTMKTSQIGLWIVWSQQPTFPVEKAVLQAVKHNEADTIFSRNYQTLSFADDAATAVKNTKIQKNICTSLGIPTQSTGFEMNLTITTNTEDRN